MPVPTPCPASHPGYLRWPAVHAQALAFVADGSLWLQAAPGQPAQRLTERSLQAREPAFSSCGRWLAFAALRGGAHELWLLDLQQGGARALSAEALPLRVCGWHPDGRVLTAWRGLLRPMLWTLRLVEPGGGGTEDLPLHDASDACFTGPRRLVFVRGGLQDDHVQRYRGGARRQLWTLDLAHDGEARPLALPPQAAAAEAWAPRTDGERLYFLCDAGGLATPWSAALDGQGAAPCLAPDAPTRDEPVDSLAIGAGRWVLACDGRLHAGPDALPLDLPLQGDWPGRRSSRDTQPLLRLEALRLHPQAGGLLRCRGRLWWLPPASAPGGGAAGETPTDSGAEPVALPWPGGRAGAMAWSADGRCAYAISDARGEPEVWQLTPEAAPLALTEGNGADCSGLWPSPCGRWLLQADSRHGLSLTALPPPGTTDTLPLRPMPLPAPDAVAGLVSGPVTDAAWAPDGQSVVLARPLGPGERQRLEHWRTVAPTASSREARLEFVGFAGETAYPCFSPVWSACGGWLFYLCARHFEAPDPHPWGDRNTGHRFSSRVRADAQAMVDGAVWPWAPATGTGQLPGFAAAPAPVRAGERRELPLPADAHARLFSGPRGLLSWVRLPRTGGAPVGGLWRLDWGASATPRWNPRAWQRVEAAGDHVLAQPADGGTGAPLLWLLPGAGGEGTATPALAPGWSVPVDPPTEWAQHLRDAWRHRRERLFDAALHEAEGSRPLRRAQAALARVTERSEVDALMARMLASLGTLHSFVTPPPVSPADGETAAFLGLQAEAVGDGLRVTRVLRGSDTDPAAQGPAATAGLREGDLLLDVAGHPLAPATDDALALARALAGCVGRRLPLTVQRPGTGRLGVVAQPHGVVAELALRHADHVRRTRAQVATVSTESVGYLHLAAMRQADLERFVRDAWAEPGWRGLVLDLRGNRGGNIDSWLIEKLMRRPWVWWSRRHGPAAPNPPGSLPEPLAVLIDGQTYSDGETLAAGLQRLGRARLFGSRTSGAGVWLRQEPNLIDGGGVAVGEFGQFDASGWLIEGRGVEPDEPVDIGPRAAAAGQDAVLMRALQWLQQRIAEAPPPPPVPAAHCSSLRAAPTPP